MASAHRRPEMPSGDRGPSRGWRAEVGFWLAVAGDVALLVARGLRRRVAPALARGVRAAARLTVAAARRSGAWLRARAPVVWRRIRHGGRVGTVLAALVAGAAESLVRRAWRVGAPAVAGAAVRVARQTARGLRAWGVWLRRWAWPRVRPVARRGMVAVVAVLLIVAVAVPLTPPALRTAARLVVDDVDGAAAGLLPLPERSEVHAADGSLIAVLPGVNRRTVPLGEIPRHARDLVVVAEDRDFWHHEGYDGRAMVRAFVANARAGNVVQGGSTITQQLAKLNFSGPRRSMLRKVDEVLHAVALEQRLPKRKLLERYLNQVYFGGGAHGIAAAAETYFGVQPRELSVAQAALLAAVIRSPNGLDPRRHAERARSRRDAVLDAAVDAKLIKAADAAKAKATPVDVLPPAPAPPPDPLVESIRRALLTNPALGATRAERDQRLQGGGLRIETTIDPELQAIAREIVQTGFPAPDGPTAAMAAVDPRSGAVRALYGGTGQRFDLASQGRRQPGSAFKPFAVAAALQSGVPANARLEGDGPLKLRKGLPEPWEVENFEKRDHGTVDLREAIVKSVNTAVAELAVDVGVEPIVEVVDRAGINVDAALGPPEARGPAIALGGLHRGVSALELAGAYGMFATGGVRKASFLVSRITDTGGNEVLRHEERPIQALPPEVNATLLPMLQEAVAEGTGTAAQLPGWTPAGKTGTTQDHADAWFVGTVPVLSTAVWVGDSRGRVPRRGMTGGTVAAPLWRAFMTRALEGHPPEPFPVTP